MPVKHKKKAGKRLVCYINLSIDFFCYFYSINLQDADIKAFINEVATITDQNFVLDPRINGNVTVISNRALSRDEIYQLIN